MADHTLTDVNALGELKEGYQNHWHRMSLERSELMKAAEWMLKHKFECEWEGDFTIAQNSSSGIGTNTIVRCCKCNKTYDVTAYESW